MPSFVPVSVAFVSDLNHPVQMFNSFIQMKLIAIVKKLMKAISIKNLTLKIYFP